MMEALKKIVARAGSGHWERTAKGEYYRREDPISDAMIAGHLDGSRPIGINIVSDPDAKKTHFIILDFDDHTGKTKPELMASRVGAVAGYLMQMNIAHSVVKSGGGRGYHIWIILEKAVGCQYALDKGKELLERGQEVLRRIWPNESFTVGTGGLFARDGIHEVEVFPKGTARMYNVALPLARASVALVGTLDNRGFATFDAGELEIQLVPPSKPGKKSDGPSVSVDRDAAFAAFIKRYDVDNYDHWGSAALCLIAAFGKGDDWAREQWESWSRTGTSFKAGDEAKWDKAGAARFSPITFWLYAKEGGYNGAHPYNTTEQRKLTALSFLDGVRLLRDEVGTAYAELAPRHFVPVQSSEFRNRVALGLHRDKNIIPDETILKSVAILTEAQASETKAERVWLRFGQAGGKRYLFLADDDCTVIEIDDSGWRVADDAPAVFRRGDCLPMPMPVSAPLSDLTEFLNVDVDNMPFLLAWMVTALYYPGGQCPIALLDGPAGSGTPTPSMTSSVWRGRRDCALNELDFFLRTLEERVDPTHLLERVVGAPADPWQKTLLTTRSPFVMCLASRRIGKSQTTGVLAAQTVAEPDRTVLILSTTLSQSQLLFKKCLLAWSKMALPIKAVRATQTALELENGSQIVCVPAGQDGESARGHGVKNGGILIYEEGAFLADAVYDSTLPIREDGGRILIITTPGRKGGVAHRFWTENGDVEKITARSTELPRMAEKVAFDRKYMPPVKFAVEHDLAWMGAGGTPYFDSATIANSFVARPQLELGNIYAGL